MPAGIVRSARTAASLSASTSLSSSKAWSTTIQYRAPSPQQSSSVAARVKSRTSCEAIERGSAGFEDITGAAHRVNQLRLEWIVRLRPQPSHHHVHDVCIRGEINVPD